MGLRRSRPGGRAQRRKEQHCERRSQDHVATTELKVRRSKRHKSKNTIRTGRMHVRSRFAISETWRGPAHFSSILETSKTATGPDVWFEHHRPAAQVKRACCASLPCDSSQNGEGEIRTRDTGVHPYDGLANRLRESVSSDGAASYESAGPALTDPLTDFPEKTPNWRR